MKLQNEMSQINEVIRRLNYYERGLVAGKKIEKERCRLCIYAEYRCLGCLAGAKSGACFDGWKARGSIDIENTFPYDKKTIKRWQTRLKRRANAKLKEYGSKWRIEWEREE